MATILIAEDDDNIRFLMKRELAKSHILLCSTNGVEAWQTISEREIDLLIADIMMPGMDGFGLIGKVRGSGSTIPILMITANQDFDLKRQGFSLGTDDYLTKPFELDELVWRVQALLKRSKAVGDRQVINGDLTMDSLSLTLSMGEQSVTLPRKEFDLLHKFLSYPGRIYTKSQLFDSVWGYSAESSENTLKTQISRLRKKISPFSGLSLKAVKGIGYRMEILDEK